MNAYEIADGLVTDPDLVTAGDRLIALSDALMQEKDKRRLLDCLYRGLGSYLSRFIWSSVNAPEKAGYYNFATGYEASGAFLALMLPSIGTSPTKALKSIKELGAMLKEAYCEPVGEAVSEEDVRTILDYLDAEYGLKKAVFNDEGDTILLLPCSHRECNSECLALQRSTGEVVVRLFLYHMSEKGVEEGADPRFVFCHELGQALLVKYSRRAALEVPEDLLDILQVFYPTIRELDAEEQVAIAADVFAMGMLYRSPFADADPFPYIQDESKAVFQDVLRLVCKKTSMGNG